MSKNTKVCVYAICKNESKNIEKWIESVKDADLIYIVDTGSTDNSVDIIKNIMQNSSTKINGCDYIQEEFSFAKARNFALSEAKRNITNIFGDENYNNWVFVALDLDEFMMKDGIEQIRTIWMNYFDTMELHGVSLDESLNVESTTPVNHKVHSAYFHWVRDIHEIIEKDNGDKENRWRVLSSDIMYTHIQDRTKERNYYDILKRSYDNGDHSSKTCIYLCWELSKRNEYTLEMKEYVDKGIYNIKYNNDDENFGDWQYLVTFYRYGAIYLSNNGYKKEAYDLLLYCLDVMKMDGAHQLRCVYRELARAAWGAGKKQLGIIYYHVFNDLHCPAGYWAENYSLYTPEEIAVNLVELSNAYWYIIDGSEDDNLEYKKLSLMYAKLAVQEDPNNTRAAENLKFLEDYFNK